MLGKTNLLFVAGENTSELAFTPEYILTSTSGNILKIEHMNNMFFLFASDGAVLYGSDMNSLQRLKNAGKELAAKHIIYADGEYYIADFEKNTGKAVVYKSQDLISFEEVTLKTDSAASYSVQGLFLSSTGEIAALIAEITIVNNTQYTKYYLIIADTLLGDVESAADFIELSDLKNLYNKDAVGMSLKKDRIFASINTTSVSGYAEKMITLDGTITTITERYHFFAADYFFIRKSGLYYSLNGVDYISIDFSKDVTDLNAIDVFEYDGNIALVYECTENGETVSKITLAAAPKELVKATASAIPVMLDYSINDNANVYAEDYVYLGSTGGIVIKAKIDNAEVERPDVVVVKGLAAKEALKQANDYTDEKYKYITKEVELHEEITKQYMENAFHATPEGYAELVDTVSENKVKIDTIIEKADLKIKNTASGEEIHLTDSADAKVVEFALYGKSKQNGTPTPDAPVEIEVSGSSGSVVVKSCGKNLFPYPYYSGENYTDAGVVFTSGDDGSIKAVGASTSNQSSYTLARDLILPKGVFLKTKATVGILVISRYIRSTSSFDAVIANNDITLFDTTDWNYEKYQYRLLFQIKKTDGNVNTILYPMISKEGGAYESYKETSATFFTNPSFGGIPVESGGNYTDLNGQQWICDKIVKYADGSGENIQKVNSFILDGSETWVKSGLAENVFYTTSKITDGMKSSEICIMSNMYLGSKAILQNMPDKTIRYALHSGTPPMPILYIKDSSFASIDELKAFLTKHNVIGYYPLANEIRTPLTAEEIAEIEKLHTFYPVTNINNNCGCGMGIVYMADSKNYIDRKVAEQVASIVESMK